VSLEGGDGGEPSNVSQQVIPRLWSCDRKGSQSKGSAVAVGLSLGGTTADHNTVQDSNDKKPRTNPY